jgi:hypothetical protein
MKKLKFNKVLFLLMLPIFIISCNLKERKLKNLFNDKVWIIDSTKYEGDDMTLLTPLEGYILKTQKDSVFDIYKDHKCSYESYKIKDDTLFLKKNKTFIPYKVEEIDENSIRLKCILKGKTNENICLTDLTDLFNGKPEQKSKIYDFITEGTWYPTKAKRIFFSDEVFIDNFSPDYYLKSNAIKINKNKNLYSNKFFLPKNTLCKFTNNSIYVFDTKNKTLTNSYAVKKVNNNQIKLTDFIGYTELEFKKIDPSLLIDEKDLPIEVRLNCNEYTADFKFREFILNRVSSEYIYDENTINYNKINECEYEFSVIRRSRSFPDIYRTIIFSLEFIEGKKIQITVVR